MDLFISTLGQLAIFLAVGWVPFFLTAHFVDRNQSNDHGNETKKG